MEGHWVTTPGSWQAASACETWLLRPYRPRRGLTRRGARVRACRWHTDWRGQGRSTHPEPFRPACLDEMTWPSGRTLRTSVPGGKRRLYGLGKTESLGVWACRGGHRSRRYRRLWPRRERLRLLASFDVEYIYVFVGWGVCMQSRWRQKVTEPHTRWWICVTMATLWQQQEGGYLLFYIFNSTVVDWTFLFLPKILVIVSTRRANCRDVLCSGRNQNCSISNSPRTFTSCKILVNRIFQMVY